MKKLYTLCALLTLILAIACGTSRKNLPPPPPPDPLDAAPPTSSVPMSVPVNSVHAPGTTELEAVRDRDRNITLAKLQEGYSIYTEGACIKCHNAFDIYAFGESRWEHIIDEMSKKAMLSAAEKDAVHKYVLSIKITQPK